MLAAWRFALLLARTCNGPVRKQLLPRHGGARALGGQQCAASAEPPAVLSGRARIARPLPASARQQGRAPRRRLRSRLMMVIIIARL
eukprot:scaffold1531_cov296-Prasinococcus_capsulatus_cf.AAC.10